MEGLQEDAAHDVGGVLQGEEEGDVLERERGGRDDESSARLHGEDHGGGGGGGDTYNAGQGPGPCVYVPDKHEGARQPGESGRPAATLFSAGFGQKQSLTAWA